jgi:hypothetical protein
MLLHQLLSHLSVTNGCKPPFFFGLKPWYQYLKTDSSCNVRDFQLLTSDGKSDLGLIALAIVDDLLRIAGLVAVGFIIYGGYLYIRSQGEPDKSSQAQNTIQNAIIGLVICIMAIALVSFIGARVS